MITFKKILQIIGLSVLVTGVVHSPTTEAAAASAAQSASLPAIHIYLNNSPITSSTGGATLKNGTVMLPLDGLSFREFTVNYDEQTQMITFKNMFTKGSMKVGSLSAMVNGKKKTYSAGPQMINKQLYIPLRFVNDAIGGSLKWNADSREAFITYPQFVGDGILNKDAYFLNGVDGTLYKRDAGGVVRSMGVSAAQLQQGYIGDTRITSVRISETADLVTIMNSSGEPSINLAVYNLFVTKGAILRQSTAKYWQYYPENLKTYNGNAVMNDGHTVRLIAPDASVLQTWNISKLAGTPDESYAIEAIGDNYILVRSSSEGMLTLIDTEAKRGILLYKEFGINPAAMPGFKDDGIKLAGAGESGSELRFEFTNNKKERKSFTYQLGGL